MSTLTMTATPRSPRVVLNLAQLRDNGAISADEAGRLEGLADNDHQRRLFANVCLIFGAISVIAAVIISQPTLIVGLSIAGASLILGSALMLWGSQEVRLLGRTLALMGVLGLSG